jgi:hypothetical protein
MTIEETARNIETFKKGLLGDDPVGKHTADLC